MSKERNELIIRRILVALDASQQSQAALEAAANVAALLDAELVGMFIEDINLLRVAQLPFVREVSFPVAETREIDVAKMQRYWQMQATLARHQLVESANKRKVRWSFFIERGSVTDRLLTASLDMDLLAIGRLGRSLSRRISLGSTARNVLERGKLSLLLMQNEVDLDQPVSVVFDGSETAFRALKIASLLALRGGSLRVLVWADDDELAQSYKSQIVDQLREEELEISYRRFYPTEDDSAVDVLQASSNSLLIIGVEGSRLSEETIQRLLESLEAALLIIR